jgi:molecular chaperone GrpE|tara:strand:+ start:1975 stop:2430 length:456 start_codon:yes stop_codon:yes gene_type:complete
MSAEKPKKKSLKIQLQEMTGLLQRTQANYENFRKQTEVRMQETRHFAARQVITELLGVIDHFDLALKNTKDKDEFEAGMKLIRQQLLMVLTQHGVEEVSVEGEFNPRAHEAVIKEVHELPENSIIEELQKGYKLGNTVLRYAKVKISAGQK